MSDTEYTQERKAEVVPWYDLRGSSCYGRIEAFIVSLCGLVCFTTRKFGRHWVTQKSVV